MNYYDKIGLDQFLIENSGMSIVPSRTDELVLKGIFRFCVAPPNGMEISDSYKLRIEVPKNFPQELPKVFEIGERIPRIGAFHINEDDGSLCLGAPVRIMLFTFKEPTLNNFSSCFIKPFLYAATLKRRVGAKFVFGELDHGDEGLLQDYSEIFKLHTLEKIKKALILLSNPPLVAKKMKCPCGCELLYGKCKYRLHLEKFRQIASKEWFKEQANNIGRNIRIQ